MAVAFQRQTFAPGDLIFRAGQPGTSLYFVESGRVRLWRGAEASPTVIGRAEPGSVFGEMAILDRQPRMAFATAEVETTVLEVPASTIREAMHEADPTLVRLIHGLLGYIRSLAAQIDAKDGTMDGEDGGPGGA